MSVGVVDKSTGDRIPTAGMPAIDDALSLISTNPVQNAIITAALADKQDKTDNNLETTSKTVVGAVNELRSGLTDYENQNNLNLEVPNRKNVLPYPYGDTTKTENGLSFTDNGDGSVTVSGTAEQDTEFVIANSSTHTSFSLDAGNYILTGCPEGGDQSKYYIGIFKNGQFFGRDYGNGLSIVGFYKTDIIGCGITIKSGTVISTPMTFYPMIRPATITDPTYAPYIPSVESRIEAVENDLHNSLVDSGHIHIVKSNNVVTLQGLFSLPYTVPNGYRPKSGVAIFVPAYCEDDSTINYAMIDSTGVIKIGNSAIQTGDYILTATYAV